ncbi:MAG: alpha/beta hydrolase, partial [Myxococcota bacterium]
TYGVEEARDLRALVDELDRRDLLVLPLGVQGTSYGAATAIQYAAIDERVTTTVAIAPFASLREVVPAYVEWMGGPLAILVSADWTRDVIDQAGDEASFDPDLACPRCVAPNIQGSLFLIHAKDDERIPWQHSVSIRDAADAQLMLVDEAGHLGIGSAAGVPEATARWFEQELR